MTDKDSREALVASLLQDLGPEAAEHAALVALVVDELARRGSLMPTGVVVVSKSEVFVRGVSVGEPDIRGPVTWCEHPADRHSSEEPGRGCADCPCLAWEGHDGPGSALDRLRNDPKGLWGTSPSYRCLTARHDACEPHGAEAGCTCRCGHSGVRPGVEGCSCQPWTTEQGRSRFLRPGESLDRVSGWATERCPLHARKADPDA